MSETTNELAITEQPLTITALRNMMNGTTLPDRYETLGDAVATIKVGQELGVPEMTSLMELYVVNGSVGMSAKLMASLVYRAGHRLMVKLTVEQAVVEAWRFDPEEGVHYLAGTFTYSQEDAERAKLMQKGPYQKHPADMLGWKAIARAVRFVFPDVILGYIPNELPAFEDQPVPAIETVFTQVDDDSEALTVEEVAEELGAVIEDAEVVEDGE